MVSYKFGTHSRRIYRVQTLAAACLAVVKTPSFVIVSHISFAYTVKEPCVAVILTPSVCGGLSARKLSFHII